MNRTDLTAITVPGLGVGWYRVTLILSNSIHLALSGKTTVSRAKWVRYFSWVIQPPRTVECQFFAVLCKHIGEQIGEVGG